MKDVIERYQAHINGGEKFDEPCIELQVNEFNDLPFPFRTILPSLAIRRNSTFYLILWLNYKVTSVFSFPIVKTAFFLFTFN